MIWYWVGGCKRLGIYLYTTVSLYFRSSLIMYLIFFFLKYPATPEIYPLPLPDALPIFPIHAVTDDHAPNSTIQDLVEDLLSPLPEAHVTAAEPASTDTPDSTSSLPSSEKADLQQDRSEEHTSELQSPCNLVCRLLLERK